MSSIILLPSRKYPTLPGVGNDLPSHTRVLEALREAVQTHERRNSDRLASFVRVQDLIDLGAAQLVGQNKNVLEWLGSTSDGGGGGGGASALADLTDVDISGVSNGDLLTYDSTSGKWVAAASGFANQAPALIPDLQFWWESDNMLLTSGVAVPTLRNRTPWSASYCSSVSGRGPLGSSSTLNSMPVINFANSSDSRMQLQGSSILDKATIFAVVRPAAFSAVQTFIAGNSSSLQFRIETTTGQLRLASANVAFIGSGSTSNMSAATWAQVNTTYNSSTGAFTYRIAKAAAGSGTDARGISTSSFSIGYNAVGGGTEDFNGLWAALLIYNRVLSGTEITNVENYLTAKWGV